MRVLIIIPKQHRASGNWVTALRFRQGLAQLGCTVVIQETEPDGVLTLAENARGFNPNVVLLLHAYRTGRPWLETGLTTPFIVMLTGTDQNQGLLDPEQSDIILKVMQAAEFIVIQNSLLATNLAETYPTFAHKIRTPSPGITLGEKSYPLFETHKLSRDIPVFLCPAGLRPVKGVLELIEMFKQVCTEDSPAQLAICGPILDTGYGEQCLAAISETSGTYYLGAIPADAMASVMRQADVIVNNSFAEGLSNTLLEAIALERPILARNIAGNAAVVRHGENGYLYKDFEEFKTSFAQLLKQETREQLRQQSPESFDPVKEAQSLFELLQQAMKN